MACADEPSPTTGTPAVTMEAPAAAGAAAAATAAADAAAPTADAAAPTEGADVAMWGAATEKEATANADDVAPLVEPQPTHVRRLFNVKKFAGGIAARGLAMASKLTRNALKFLGVPYEFGGTTRAGFDCSGYVQHVFAMIGVHLPRTADAQYAVAHKIKGRLRPGDLVFFETYAPGVSHVGISLGGDKFVSASGRGVSVSSLHDAYWSARYLGAKRVVE